MSRQHELRGDLHFAVCVVFEGGEVGLVFVGVNLFPVPVVSCRSKWGEQWGLQIQLLTYYILETFTP